jgi:hypothetical protein
MRQFQHGRGSQANGGKSPGNQIGFDMHNGAFAVEIGHVDGESHGERVNATARANPESTTIAEVILGGSDQAAQAGPMRLSHSQVRGKIALARLVKSLAVRD